MDWYWSDLLLFSGAVYGLAWIVTRSKLLRGLRETLSPVPFIGELVQCIVCTGTWIGLGLMLLLPWTGLFSQTFRVSTPVDALVLLGWTVSFTWILGSLLHDAD